MFTGRPSRGELQAENESLRAALEQAKVSLAEFRLQEHDLADVLVRARAEARDLVESARTEARDLVERAETKARELAERARTEADAAIEGARTEAHGLTELATEEARQLREAAQSEVNATLADVEHTERQLLRLRGVQRELEASLQQSLAALAPVLSLAAEAAPRPAARIAPVPPGAAGAAPVPLAPVPPALVPAPVAPASRPVAPLPVAPVPIAPVSLSPAPVLPVPVAPVAMPPVAMPPVPAATVPVEPVPVARAAGALASVATAPVPPPEIKSTGALDIFPLEMGVLRPFERARNQPRVMPRPPARAWSVRFPKLAPTAKVVAAGIVIGIAIVAWSAWGARERADQTDAAAMVPSATPVASSATATPAALKTSAGSGTARATRTDGVSTRTVGRLAQAPGLFTVVVEAVRPVWVRADTDGKRELARTVGAGERVELHAAREITLRAGDAGAVLASVNGGAKAPLGPDGTVITRRIAGPAAASTPKPAQRPGTQRLLEAVASREPAGDSSSRLPEGIAAASRPTGAQPRSNAAVSPEPPLTTPDIPLPTSPGPALASPGPRAAATSAAPAANPAPSPAPSSPLSPAETEVFGAHETYFDALRRGDQAAMSKVMASNFTATGVPAPVGTDSLAVNSISVQVSGVGAVVSGVASRRDSGADGRSTQLLFSEVWTNADGQWQLLSVRFIEAPKK